MVEKDKAIIDYLAAVDAHLEKLTNNTFTSPGEYDISFARLQEMKRRLIGELEPEPVMQKYYFTFGSSGQIFRGGWVEIIASSAADAQQKFIDHYGDKARDERSGLLRYSDHYSEERFKATVMYEHGNFGECCHEVIE